MATVREGSLEAPKRAAIDWQHPDYTAEQPLYAELERVFDICHTCRRCVSLCQSFPTLFDLVDGSDTLEVDGVAKADYMQVVDQCYLCDLCAETKCPYLPPHEWAVDFPHLMLRAKAHRFQRGESKWRDRLITSTDTLFGGISRAGLAGIANAANNNPLFRNAMAKVAGIHSDADLPAIASRRDRARHAPATGSHLHPQATDRTTGKLAVYRTCYGQWHGPELVGDLQAVCHHNAIATVLVPGEACCGMPKLELGDLQAVARLKERNIPRLKELVDQGFDLTAPVPSCVLMYRQELPLMFPDDADVQAVAAAFFDPMEYLSLRHKRGLLKTDFRHSLGTVSYQVACHQRVQNIGRRTSEVLGLIPDTTVQAIERCSGHDGTYAVKAETHAHSLKLARPVARRVDQANPDAFTSDCPLAGQHVARVAESEVAAEHPISLLRRAYGLTPEPR